MERNYVQLGEVPFYGDFLLYEYGTGHLLHDSRKDAGDVPPLLYIAPVKSITIKDGLFNIEVLTEWKEC